MFTGLVTDVGTIRKAEDRNGLRRFEVACSYPVESIEMGASIMHAGVCLTVVDFGPPETAAGLRLRRSRRPVSDGSRGLGTRQRGQSRTEFELGQELGGHFVFGHVDGVGEVSPSNLRARAIGSQSAHLPISRSIRQKGVRRNQWCFAHRSGCPTER